MRYTREIFLIAFLHLLLLCPLVAQREVSYRIVLDDREVPREVLARIRFQILENVPF